MAASAFPVSGNEDSMKKIFALLTLLGTVAANAMCPSIINCSLDGEGMTNSGSCYFNGMHETCKFTHTHYGVNGPEHHYVMVQCS